MNILRLALIGLLVTVFILNLSVLVAGPRDDLLPAHTIAALLGLASTDGVLGRIQAVLSGGLREVFEQARTLQEAQAASSRGAAETQVMSSARHTTISWDENDPDRSLFELPLLYLHRERYATALPERTLDISLAGFAPGTEVQIEARSRHVDVSTGKPHILARRFVLPDRACTLAHPCPVRWTFDGQSARSDIYHLRVNDTDGHLMWQSGSPDRPDFVMLDTWDVELGADQNPPNTVRIVYATLFPFARTQHQLGDRLKPDDVIDFVADQFVPLVRDTWHTQMQVWGFGDPIHPDWDADNIIEIIVTDSRYALFEGIGTYHVSVLADGRPYPQRRLWWQATNDSFQAYVRLADAYRSVFAHEFFHLAQWNVVLSTGCGTDRWRNAFIEAQGKFAPTVQYPMLAACRRETISPPGGLMVNWFPA